MSDFLLGYPNTPENIALGKEKYVLDWRGDIQFDNRGKLLLVESEDKLRQNIGKILLTAQGQSITNPDYGSTIQTFVGTPLLTDPVYTLLKQTILDALGFYVDQYSDSTNANEKVATVETLSVRVNDSNPTSLTIEVGITNEASKSSGIRILLE